MNIKKAVIFDMDGVLIDSTHAILESFSCVLKELGIEKKPLDLKSSLGMSLRDQIALWKKEYPDCPFDMSPEEFSARSMRYEMKLIEKSLKPNSFLLEIIDGLKALDFGIAVATSSTRKRAEICLEYIDVFSRLDAFVTCEDVERHKPHPDIFLEAASRMAVAPSHCIVVEDAVNGIAAAKKAGMIAIAKLTDHHSRSDFSEADCIFQEFSEIDLASWLI